MATPPPPAIIIIFGVGMLILGLALGILGINQSTLRCDRATDMCTVTRRIPDRTESVALSRVHQATAVARPKAGEVDAVLGDGAGQPLLRLPVARAEVDRVVVELGELIAGKRDGVQHIEGPTVALIAGGGLMFVVGVGGITLGLRRRRA